VAGSVWAAAASGASVQSREAAKVMGLDMLKVGRIVTAEGSLMRQG
jgi:hypothetical protein